MPTLVSNYTPMTAWLGLQRALASIEPSGGHNTRFHLSRELVDVSQAQSMGLPLLCVHPGGRAEIVETPTGEQRYEWEPIVVCYLKGEGDWMEAALACEADILSALWADESLKGSQVMFVHVPAVDYFPPETRGGIGAIYLSLRIVLDVLRSENP